MYKGYWEQSEQYADEEAEESQRLRDEANENKAESSLTPTHKSSSSSKQREAEKITVPQWPKVADLQIWKTRVLTSVLIACGDNDQGTWGAWLGEAMVDRPDMDALF